LKQDYIAATNGDIKIEVKCEVVNGHSYAATRTEKRLNHDKYKKAFTLIEVLVTLTIILILVGIMTGLGKYLKTSSSEDLTESAIQVVGLALEQYYSVHTAFPPQIDSKADWETELGSAITLVPPGTAPADAEFWQSSALFYYLDQTPASRQFLESLAAQMTTNKNASGVKLVIEIPTGGTKYDLVRIVDAWGRPLRYEYAVGDVFPQVISAGADGKFDTGDDLKNF